MQSLEQSPVSDRELGPTLASSVPPYRRPKLSSTPRWTLLRACARARRALLSLRLREASRAIAQIQGLLGNGDQLLRLRYEPALAALRAAVLLAEDDLPQARELLLDCTRAAAGEGSFCKTLLRYIDWLRGEATEPGEAPHNPDSAAHKGRSVLEQILTLCVNAALEFEHLRPIISANLAAEALRIASERYGAASSVSTLPAVLLAQVVYEQGRLTEAECLIRPRMTAILASGTAECLLRACLLLVRISTNRGQRADALACLRQVEAIARTRGWRRLLSVVRAEQTRILSSANCANGATPHASQFPALSSTGTERSVVVPQYSSVHAALARIASESSSLTAHERRALLISCLRIGATRGLYRLFVDAGAPVRRLLGTLYEAHGSASEAEDLRAYVGLLLRTAASASAPARRPIEPAHQPLSRREQAILRMIAHGLSNKKIAQSLGIAPETVKSHAKSIFVKLGTRTRAEAVARAASIGLPYGAGLALGLSPPS